MSKDISIWDLPTSPANFASWATSQRRDCSRREKLARATGAGASSSWPTPTAQDAGYFPDLMIGKGEFRVASPIQISEGSCGQFSINNASPVWTHLWMIVQAMGLDPAQATFPCSRPVRVIFPHGQKSSLSDLSCNPLFYEWVMGWPTGWSDPAQPVTEFAAWLRRSRGALSAMPILAPPVGRQTSI